MPPLPLPLATPRGPSSAPIFLPAHTGASAQTFTSSTYSPAGTPVDEHDLRFPQMHNDVHGPPGVVCGNSYAMRDLREGAEEEGKRDDDEREEEDDDDDDDHEREKHSRISYKSMHLTAADHAADPAGRYELMELLGTGNFGKVFKAEIQEEITHLQACDSRYITRYYGSFVKGYKLWIVMEFLAGSVSDLLKPAPFSEPNIATTIHQMLLGLEYLHGLGKIHRDIKAANVLVSARGEVKLADFGVSSQLSHAMSRRFTFVGTPFWMAPEVISRQAGYDTKADIWSLGITAYELAKGEPPHADKHPMKVVFLIPQTPAPRLDPREAQWSAEFRDFVGACLEKDPEVRPTATELLAHPFLRKAGPKRSLIRLINRYAEWKHQQLKRNPRAGKSFAQPQPAPTVESYADMTMMSEWEFEDGGGGAGDAAAKRGTGTVKGITVVGLPGRDSGRPAPLLQNTDEQTEQATPGLGSVGEGYEEDERGSLARLERERLNTVVVVDPALNPPGMTRVAYDEAVRSVTPSASGLHPGGRSGLVESDSESVSSTQRTIKPAAVYKTPQTPQTPPHHAHARREPTALGKAAGAKAVLSSAQQNRTPADVVIDQAALKNATSAADVQALQSLQQGFKVLGTSNPELADQLMVDMLAGIRENRTVRAHLTRKAKARSSLEDIRDSFPSVPSSAPPSPSKDPRQQQQQERTPRASVDDNKTETKEGYQIADVLYLRWLDNLRLKWPLGGNS
ncbi:hypothetical protein QFC21_004680 [Naganishia friedmannii]|uniref:Uncharacterized protein n=1 Tax=Naganishia friedmannii TaxID=89922 RepID=A0ACC2VE22_9TREE|nr:hypothetical protein QFC21_004680 [Naganishia friedmannii]